MYSGERGSNKPEPKLITNKQFDVTKLNRDFSVEKLQGVLNPITFLPARKVLKSDVGKRETIINPKPVSAVNTIGSVDGKKYEVNGQNPTKNTKLPEPVRVSSPQFLNQKNVPKHGHSPTFSLKYIKHTSNPLHVKQESKYTNNLTKYTRTKPAKTMVLTAVDESLRFPKPKQWSQKPFKFNGKVSHKGRNFLPAHSSAALHLFGSGRKVPRRMGGEIIKFFSKDLKNSPYDIYRRFSYTYHLNTNFKKLNYPDSSNRRGFVTFYRNLLNDYAQILMAKINRWTRYAEECGKNCKNSFKEKVNDAVGKAKLLTNIKFRQFLNMLNDYDNCMGQGQSSHIPARIITAHDIEVFWKIMEERVEQCENDFQKLEKAKDDLSSHSSTSNVNEQSQEKMDIVQTNPKQNFSKHTVVLNVPGSSTVGDISLVPSTPPASPPSSASSLVARAVRKGHSKTLNIFEQAGDPVPDTTTNLKAAKRGSRKRLVFKKTKAAKPPMIKSILKKTSSLEKSKKMVLFNSMIAVRKFSNEMPGNIVDEVLKEDPSKHPPRPMRKERKNKKTVKEDENGNLQIKKQGR